MSEVIEDVSASVEEQEQNEVVPTVDKTVTWEDLVSQFTTCEM